MGVRRTRNAHQSQSSNEARSSDWFAHFLCSSERTTWKLGLLTLLEFPFSAQRRVVEQISSMREKGMTCYFLYEMDAILQQDKGFAINDSADD